MDVSLFHKDVNFRLLHFVTHTRGFALFYNTYLMKRFVVVPHSSHNTMCDVMIYDGPSSRSQLLNANINTEGRLQYKSTLFCIAVYFKNIIAPYRQQNCLNISVIQEKIGEHNRIISKGEDAVIFPFDFCNHLGNLNHALMFETEGMYVNIQFQTFQYTGNTEAGCYLGGIVFYTSETDQWFGPFCGEFGMSLLAQKGLTFGSHLVYSYIYLFTESTHQRITFEIKLKGEKCVGIINPCGLKEQPYKEYTVRYTFMHDSASIAFNNDSSGVCMHIQHFLERLTEKECRYEYDSFFRGIVLNASATVYFDKFQAQRCMDCSSAAGLQIYEIFDLPWSVNWAPDN